ncbi:unnamed protein product [Prorocentrum cordatum]|uniref:Feruloyl esterase n=1 Tax=Prorocentrum cordatum TaxID=2364126 RepID=A0ABN9TX18_9DINO|nr:unnamed protein product [Polarella glacialis]
MALARKAAVAALAGCAASLSVHSGQAPDPAPASTARMTTQWSETRLGPPMSVSDACSVPWNFSTQSEWKEPDPITFPHAGLGARRVMTAINGMSYQLYLPPKWNNNSLHPYPVHIDLHSHGERKWTLKNSQGFARMLARNQSTSFDNRSCWCLDSTQSYSMAYDETSSAPYYLGTTSDTGCPMADCTFADTFPGLVIMPQCWTGSATPGWTSDCLLKAKDIAASVIATFNGDADKVVVSGTSEGGVGALAFATTYKSLVSAVVVTDAPTATVAGDLDGVPVYVTGDSSHSGITGIDALVVALQARASGVTKYTRFVSAPAAADPGRSKKKQFFTLRVPQHRRAQLGHRLPLPQHLELGLPVQERRRPQCVGPGRVPPRRHGLSDGIEPAEREEKHPTHMIECSSRLRAY